jgi:rhodanese-related sulfurtransferase
MTTRVELPPAREVCPTTTRRLIAEGAQLVDVRELSEVAQLTPDVPGVLLMPVSELEQRFAELPRDRELVLVCESGARSLKATYFLMFHGYDRVASMSGGLFKWAGKGFPITGRLPATTPASAGGCCGGQTGADTGAEGCGCAKPAAASRGACCG